MANQRQPRSPGNQNFQPRPRNQKPRTQGPRPQQNYRQPQQQHPNFRRTATPRQHIPRNYLKHQKNKITMKNQEIINF